MTGFYGECDKISSEARVELLKEMLLNRQNNMYIKLKLSKTPLDVSINSLNNLFKQVEHSNVPIVYKAILLSKISRKISTIQPNNKESLQQQKQVLDLLNLVNLNDLNQNNILSQKGLSPDEQAFLHDMLGEKIDLIKTKHINPGQSS